MIELFKQQFEETLLTLIPSPASLPASIVEGTQHVLLAPGKRLRPLLTLCTTHLLQKELLEHALYPACALEMIHTYSLIHDDLPCMDNDDFRRGRPTLHRLYTEGHAVLIGDYLLTYAFEVITRSPFLTAQQKVSLSQALACAAGGEGMIGGQVMDIENSHEIAKMHAGKTAALFRVALEFGGIIAKASDETLTQLKTFGMLFGKLYQIVDDLLDHDHALGEKQAQETMHSLHQKTLLTLDTLPGETTYLSELTHFVMSQVEDMQQPNV